MNSSWRKCNTTLADKENGLLLSSCDQCCLSFDDPIPIRVYLHSPWKFVISLILSLLRCLLQASTRSPDQQISLNHASLLLDEPTQIQQKIILITQHRICCLGPKHEARRILKTVKQNANNERQTCHILRNGVGVCITLRFSFCLPHPFPSQKGYPTFTRNTHMQHETRKHAFELRFLKIYPFCTKTNKIHLLLSIIKYTPPSSPNPLTALH